jgi:hypothetical protein
MRHISVLDIAFRRGDDLSYTEMLALYHAYKTMSDAITVFLGSDRYDAVMLDICKEMHKLSTYLTNREIKN